MSDCAEQYMWIDSPSYEWVDSELISWGECSDLILNQIYTDLDYVYAVTNYGLNIIDIISENKVSYIDIISGFTTVWGNEDYLYLGTPNDGVKYLEKDTISGSIASPIDLSDNLKGYDFQYNPSSPEINFLHGYNDILSVVTTSGIDILKNGIGSFKSSTKDSGITKCILTSKRELYYVIQNTIDDGVFKVNTVLCDWDTPDVSYLSGASFLPPNQNVNDIYVTVDTSETGEDNTLFVATSSGIFIWDEGTGGFNTYYTE